jgi:hypothetical protein
VFFRNFYICAVAVVSSEIVVHDMADFVKRGRLEENFRLFFQKVCGHVDDECLVTHLLVAHDVRKHIANRLRVVSGLDRIINNAKADLIARRASAAFSVLRR